MASVLSVLVLGSFYDPDLLISPELLVVALSGKVLSVFLVDGRILRIIIERHHRLNDLLTGLLRLKARGPCDGYVLVVAGGADRTLLDKVVRVFLSLYALGGRWHHWQFLFTVANYHRARLVYCDGGSSTS